jgi:glycosyltransferase involved in cell wall biosynthesis
MTLSVVLITHNEEANLDRTLASVQPLVTDGKGEIIVVDSGSTDRTVEIAKSHGARVFVEDWKGYAAQKNSAIDKASGDWILSLDADEELDSELQKSLQDLLEGIERLSSLAQASDDSCAHQLTTSDAKEDVEYHIGANYDSSFAGLWIPRKNEFLARWVRHGGFWPDPKLRFFRRGQGTFEARLVHEDLQLSGRAGKIRYGALLHHSYPTLADYIDHMNRYSSLGAEMVAAKGRVRFSPFNIILRPAATFLYNYIFRLGFLDGREGLLLHLYHAAYVSWKYSKAWELGRQKKTAGSSRPDRSRQDTAKW